MANSVSGKTKDGLEEGEIEDDVEESRHAMSSRSHSRFSSKRPVQRQQLRISRPNAKGVNGWGRSSEIPKNTLSLNQSSENLARSPRAKSDSERHRDRSKTAPGHQMQDLRDKMASRRSRPTSNPIRPATRDSINSTNKLGRYPWYRTKRYPSRTPVRVIRNSAPRPTPRPANTTSFTGTRPSGSSNNSSCNNNNNNNNKSGSSVNKSSHDEFSYEDLLLQYKSIQSQLEDLKREEAKSDQSFRLDAEHNLDKENFKGEGRRKSWKDDPRFGKLDRFSLGAEALRTRRRRNRNRLHTLTPTPLPSSTVSAPKTQEEDDEMELRRIALASKLTRKRRLSVRNSGNSDLATMPSGQGSIDDTGLAISDECVVQGCDNYEEVAMELDSNCGDDLGEDLGVELEDEDEEALRNHLLLSLHMKKKTVKLDSPQPLVNTDKGLTNDLDGEMISEEVVQKSTELSKSVGLKEKEATDFVSAAKAVMATSVAPIHKQVIINLAEDSSDSDSDENSSPLLSTIDQFLKEARRTAETKQGSSVLRLSGSQVQEYRRLKEEIAKREQITTKPDSRIEQEEQVQNEACDKRLAIKESEMLVKGSELVRVEQAHLLIHKNSRPPEAKTQKPVAENLSDEHELRLLRTAMVKKRALLTASEQQVKRFQEQLAAAQKVVAAHRSTVQKISNQITVVKKRLNDRTSLMQTTESEKIQNVSVNKRAKLGLLARVTPKKQRIVRLRKVSTFTPQQLAQEKLRLQRLEQETLLRLQALRQTKGLHVATKPMLDAKEPVTSISSPVKKKLLVDKEVMPKSPLVPEKTNLSSSSNNVNQTVESQTAPKNACRLVESDEYTACTSSPFLLDSPLNGESKDQDIQVNCNEIVPFDLCNVANPLAHLRCSQLDKLSDPPVNSLSFAHKIDPNWTFCSFDLLGTCNDDQCPWQHLPRTK